MARVLEDVRLFAGGCDLRGVTSKTELSAERETKDVTSFASGLWSECRGGLAKAAIKASGFAEFGAPGTVEYDAYSRLGERDAWTIGPDGADVGDLAWLTDILRGKYGIGGAVGDVCPWSAEGSSSWPLVRGVFLHPPGTARTDDGSGTAVQHVAVAAGQRLYATLHVISATGSAPTIDVVVASDSVQTFDATPETRLTFAQRSAVGGEIVRTAAGAHADTWYRVQYNCSEVGDESFLFVAAVGVA